MIIIFISITISFLILLGIKQITKMKFCVLCLSVSATWITLLALYWLGLSINPILIAVLIGQSIVGTYYLVEKKVSESMQIFRLPFLLTMTFLAYFFLDVRNGFLGTFIFLGFLWCGFVLLFLYRNNTYTKRFVQKIIACCRDW